MNVPRPTGSFQHLGRRLARLRIGLFLVGIGLLFAYMGWQTYQAVTIGPAAVEPAATTSTATQHIDQTTIDKIQQLQDNSTQVQALFDQARQNPFQE